MWVRYDHDGSLILRRLDELLFVSFWATPSLVAASKPFVLFLPIPRAYYLLPGISALVISQDQHKTHLQARLPSTIQLQEYAKPSPSSSSSPSSSRYSLLSRKQKRAVVKMTQFKRTFQMFKQLYFWISRFIRISGESQRLWQKSFKVFETEVRGTYGGFQKFFFSSQDVLPKLWINFQQGQQSWVFCKINPKVKLYSADKQNSPNYPCSGNLSESTTNWGKNTFIHHS